MRATVLLALGLALAGTVPALAQVPERHAHPGTSKAATLGQVAFANSGSAAAQEPFLRGLALLHSFEYEEAAEAFRTAAQADSRFAMAYWGEALTYSHLLWGEDDPAAARAALNRLAPTRAARLARAGTPRERRYGAAVEALFAEADLPARTRAFADSMRQVVASYPDDVDAAAFAALALMFVEYVGELPPDRRTAARAEAIRLAERVFRTHPKHPGSTHYLIHATDDPAFAARGLAAARSYAQLAPDAEHALHMPSHIFLQLGLWDDVVAANERAWVASRAEVVARKLSPADLSFHTLQWLQYGYLQQGRYRAARALIDTAQAVLAGTDLTNPAHADARYTVAWLEFMQAAQADDFAAFCGRARTLPAAPQNVSDRERSFRAVAAYQAAVAAVMCGNLEAPAVQHIRTQVQTLPDADATKAMFRNAQLHVDALVAYRRSDNARAIELLAPVAAAPARPPVGPPPLLRTHELLGAALLKAGRPGEAIAAYQRALELTPNRSLALLGLARARVAAGDRAGAAGAYRQLLAVWRNADADLASLAEAKTGADVK